MSQFTVSPGTNSLALEETDFRFGTIFREITHRLANGNDSKKIFDFLFDSLDLLIPYDRIGIALVDDSADNKLLRYKWMRSKIPTSHIVAGYCAPLKGSSLEKILETGVPRIINDLEAYSLEHPRSKSTKLIIRDGIRSSLTCPLRTNNKFVGIVFFSCSAPNAYKDEHVHTYMEIADELSLIVEHGRLRKNEADGSQNLRMALHDLKNPLSVIQGFLDMTKDMDWYEDLDPEAKHLFTILKRNSNYMLELLNDLSEMTRLNIEAESSVAMEIELQELVSDLAIRSSELANKKNIQIDIAANSNVPERFFIDVLKVRRVLDNLITNAVKYSTRGTKISVVIKRDSSRLVFEVTDQGQGIPIEELPKLFKEFSRTSVRPTEGESSSGLGLAIAKKIVDQLGGEVSVQSTFGKGSTFSFWIPLHENSSFH